MSINSKFTISDFLLNKESLQKKNKYSCPICFEYFYKKSIYQCKFGHVACQECWEKSLKSKKECMICRSKVNSTNDLSRCLVIEQDFGKKECYCIYSFNNYDFIDCANEKIKLVKDEENGCKEIIKIDQLDKHIQKELENHHTECSKYPIECPQICSNIIERNQIKSHIENDCNNSTIPCKYYEYGCKVEMKRSELPNHLNNVNHQYFMGLLIEKLSSKLNQSHNIQHELVKKIEQSEKTQEILNKEYDQSKAICDKIFQMIKQSEKMQEMLKNEFDQSKIISDSLFKKVEQSEKTREMINKEYDQSKAICDKLIKKIEQSEKTQEMINKEYDQSKVICDKLFKKIEQSYKTQENINKQFDQSKKFKDRLVKMIEQSEKTQEKINKKFEQSNI
ncbi:hypothetical protein ACTFIZ_011970 [Dictyostelium cf. discoideum]